jgi:hypothetical protein
VTDQTGDVLAVADERLATAGWHVQTTRDGTLVTSEWVGPDGRPNDAEFVRLVHGEHPARQYEAIQRRRREYLRGQTSRRRRHRVVDLLLAAGALLVVAQLVRVAVYAWHVLG